jgi:hypothetical protein
VVLALVVVWTAASVPIGLAIWPPAAGAPPGRLLPFFMIVSLFEGAAFGLGVVFLVFGRRLIGARRPLRSLTGAAYLSLAWLLLNWWPHDGLHRSGFGRTFAGVATIDMAFHTTLILGAAVVTVFFVRANRSPAAAAASRQAAEPAGAIVAP